MLAALVPARSGVRFSYDVQYLWLNMKMRTLKSMFLSFSLLLAIVSSSAAVESSKVDEVANFNWEDLMARLDLYSVQLQNEPASSGYIIVYDGRRSRRGEAQGWMQCVKNYMVERRGMASNRIMIVKGGYRRNMTVEMWLVPPADSLPKATPTVKPENVKFRKGRLKGRNWRSLCNI